MPAIAAIQCNHCHRLALLRGARACRCTRLSHGHLVCAECAAAVVAQGGEELLGDLLVELDLVAEGPL